jgi:hypothetical protein
MTTVAVKAHNVASFPDGGGHFWVFAQYVQALTRLGCRVVWLERFESQGKRVANRRALRLLRERVGRLGAAEILLYRRARGSEGPVEHLIGDAADAAATMAECDLLLNFDYSIEPEVLERFRLSALVDIDPGLLQFWVSEGQLSLPAHDRYLTIGETVGTPGARFPDLGVEWIRFHPPVALDLWPFRYRPDARAFTTVSGWWGGGGKGEWITDGREVFFENNKRVTFLRCLDLPARTGQRFELALALGDGDDTLPAREEVGSEWTPSRPPPEVATDYVSDALDRAVLERHGWRVVRAPDVAAGPRAYQRYVEGSRAEFSCAKPSCMYFANAWVSDRTICYLASGKPVVVEDTGPSEFLPSGEGMFRFSDVDGAAAAVEAVNADYRSQCDAARALAESAFDATAVLSGLLDRVLGAPVGR